MVAATSLVLALLVAAPSYRELAEGAERVPNLGRFLEQYVGDCDSTDPRFDKKACEAAAAQVQRDHAGRLLRLEPEDGGERLQLAKFDAAKGAFRLHLTPLFADRALALTLGRPLRLNGDGQPVLKNLPVWVKKPIDDDDLAFRRALERGMVRLELLVRPRGAWRLERRGEASALRGVEAELVGLKVVASRGGAVLAEETY
jgi:hypothetical protein